LGMVVLLYLFSSCSLEEPYFGEQETIDSTAQDDESEAGNIPSVTIDEDSEDEPEPSLPDNGEDGSEDEPEPSPDNEEDDSDDGQESSLPENGENDSDDEMESVSPDSGGDDSDDEPEPSLPDEYSDFPELLINELRTQYEGSSLRAEYIEFKIKNACNLDGVRVFIASNYSEPLVYEFLPVNVKKNEYILLHLRTLEDSCVDEYGSNLNESGGTDSSPAVRDFWVPTNKELLRKTDIVYVLDKDGNVLDAVMFAEDTTAESWPKLSRQDCFTPAAEFLFNMGAWLSSGETIPCPSDAVNTSVIKSSVVRSISRNERVEDTNTAADWYVTESGDITPGRVN